MRGIPEILKYEVLCFPTLQAVQRAGGSATIEEIEEYVADILSISEKVLSLPHKDTGRTEFQYRLAWVRTYLKKVGALQNSARSVWSVTDIGRRMTEAEAKGIFKKVRAANRRDQRRTEEPDGDDRPEGHEDWTDQLLSALGEMAPDAFERLCQRLLRESGFVKVEVTGKSGDGGIDGQGVLRVNLVSFQVLFQCKRWKGSVGSSVVRDFRGAMVGRADKGLIITTSSFTPDAKREAVRDGAPAIDLVEGEDLCELLKDRRLGVAVEMVEDVKVDVDFFATL